MIKKGSSPVGDDLSYINENHLLCGWFFKAFSEVLEEKNLLMSKIEKVSRPLSN